MVVKNLNLLKKEETKGLLSKLGIKTPLSKTPKLGDIFFNLYNNVNKIVNKFYWQVINLCRKCIWGNPDLLIELVVDLLKIKKEFKSLKKQEILNIFIKMN